MVYFTYFMILNCKSGTMLPTNLFSYCDYLYYLRIKHEIFGKLETNIGVMQGCILSPVLFSLKLDDVMKEVKKEIREYIRSNR